MQKAFFKEPTAVQMLKRDRVRDVDRSLVREIEDCEDYETLVIRRRLIPIGSLNGFRNDKHFMKHGRELALRRFRNLREVTDARLRPLDLRRKAFKRMRNRAYCGYTMRPYWGGDNRLRRFSLVEIMKGAMIIGFVHQIPGEEIKVEPYIDSLKTSEEGGNIIVKVPSRTEGKEPYEILFESIPVWSNDDRWGTIYLLESDHVCVDKRYKMRFKQKGDRQKSKAVDFCAHDSAGYLAACDFLYRTRGTIIPTEMNPFAYPSQAEVDFWGNLGHNVLIQTSDDDRPRKLLTGEREILLGGKASVHADSNDSFFGVRIKEYNWRHVDDY